MPPRQQTKGQRNGQHSVPRKGAKRPAAKQTTSSKKPKKAKMNKYDVLSDPDKCIGPADSILYDPNEIDLVAVLNHPKVRAVLEGTEAGAALAALTPAQLKEACKQFRIDGAAGLHDKDYLAEALMASERRKNGEFDDYLAAKYEETWGDDSDEEDDEDDDEPDDESAEAAAKAAVDDDEALDELMLDAALEESKKVLSKQGRTPDGLKLEGAPEETEKEPNKRGRTLNELMLDAAMEECQKEPKTESRSSSSFSSGAASMLQPSKKSRTLDDLMSDSAVAECKKEPEKKAQSSSSFSSTAASKLERNKVGLSLTGIYSEFYSEARNPTPIPSSRPQSRGTDSSSQSGRRTPLPSSRPGSVIGSDSDADIRTKISEKKKTASRASSRGLSAASLSKVTETVEDSEESEESEDDDDLQIATDSNYRTPYSSAPLRFHTPPHLSNDTPKQSIEEVDEDEKAAETEDEAEEGDDDEKYVVPEGRDYDHDKDNATTLHSKTHVADMDAERNPLLN